MSSVQKIIDLNLEFVFTDGHAVDGFSSQYTANAIEDIETILDMNAIKAKYWKDENDLDRKRRKEAEFLVLGDIAKEALLGFVTFNDNAKNTIASFGADHAKVHVGPTYYF